MGKLKLAHEALRSDGYFSKPEVQALRRMGARMRTQGRDHFEEIPEAFGGLIDLVEIKVQGRSDLPPVVALMNRSNKPSERYGITVGKSLYWHYYSTFGAALLEIGRGAGFIQAQIEFVGALDKNLNFMVL